MASKGSKAHKKRTISHARGKAAEGKRAKVRKTSKLAGEKYTPEFLSEILSSMSDYAFVIDENYALKFLNEAGRRFYGDGIGEKCYRFFRKYAAPCHLSGVRCEVHEILEKGADSLEDVRFTEAVGRITHVRARPTRTFDGKRGVITVARDVTEETDAKKRLQESERALQEQLNFMQQLIDRIPTPIFYKDADGLYRGCNSAFETYHGFAKKEIIGKSLYDLFPKELADMYHRMDSELLHNPGTQAYETQVRCADGSMHDVIFNKATYTDADGRTAGIVGVVTDITEHKRMEETVKLYTSNLEKLVEDRSHELKRSEAKYRLLMDNMADIVFAIDLNGNFTFVSPIAKELTGYSPERFLSMNMKELIAPEYQPQILERLQARIRGEKIKPTYGFEIIRADGNRLPIEIRTTPILDEDGKIVGVQGIARDITERKVMEEALHRVHRLAVIGETAAMVGHDLRNPLQGITAAAYVLKTELRAKLDEKVRTMLEIIEKDIEYADKIVNDLLEYSGEIHLHRTKTSQRSLMEEALASARVPENIQVSNLTGHEPEIEVDVNRLKRVYVNLIRNAVEAMPSGGSLTIRSGRLGDEIELRLTDTGEGVTKEIMEKIWEPLYTTKPRGMGFGLAVCKRIVEAHGGTVTVDSTVRKGTTFTIRLPIKPALTDDKGK